MSHTISRRQLLGGIGLTAVGAALFPSMVGCAPGDAARGTNLLYNFNATNTANRDAAKVSTALSRLLSDRGLNFGVDLTPVADYDQQMRLQISAGDAGDLFFTAPWANNFGQNASQGNLLAIEDLLKEHAPGLWGSLSPEVWNAARVNGDIYGVINQQRFPKMWGFFGGDDVLERYGIDPASIASYAELEPYLARIKQEQPDLVPWQTDAGGNGALFKPEIYGWDPIAIAYGLAVRHDDPDLKVFNMYDTPEYAADVREIRRWREAGYVAATPPSNADANTMFQNRQNALSFGQITPSNPQYYAFPTSGACFVSEPLLNTDGVCATLIGVSATTEQPEQVIQFLELMNTDRDVYNMVCFGIEGENWEYADEALDVVTLAGNQTAETAGWNPNSDWQFGNQFNAHYRNLDDAEKKRWELEAELNANATVSNAIGFTVDVSALQTEAATISAAVGEFGPQAGLGLLPADEALSQLLSRLDTAGMPKLLEAAQEQIDDWNSTR